MRLAFLPVLFCTALAPTYAQLPRVDADVDAVSPAADAFAGRPAITYQGFAEGVHPLQLVLDADGVRASLQVAEGREPVALLGACAQDRCRFRGADTALAITFVRDGLRLGGELRSGDGVARAFSAGEVPPSMLFPRDCAGGKWLRQYRTPGARQTLTLVALPGDRFAGAYFDAADSTTYFTRGGREGEGVRLSLRRAAGVPGGRLEIAAAHLPAEGPAGELQVTRHLAGDSTALTFAPAEALPVGCIESASRFDLIFPLTGEARADATLERRASRWWGELLADGAIRGTGWFAPTHLDSAVLSGWLYLSSDVGEVTYALAVDRASGRDLRLDALEGRRRERQTRRRHARQQATAAHPLREDPGFADWADAQGLAGFAVVPEGLAYASPRHPTYGQLVWVEPWSAFTGGGEVPGWLRGVRGVRGKLRAAAADVRDGVEGLVTGEAQPAAPVDASGHVDAPDPTIPTDLVAPAEPEPEH